MRRSMRGSIKIKQTYDHLRENGDGGTLNPSASRSPHDFDIKLLQQKRQQAEMKRYIFVKYFEQNVCFYGWLILMLMPCSFKKANFH